VYLQLDNAGVTAALDVIDVGGGPVLASEAVGSSPGNTHRWLFSSKYASSDSPMLSLASCASGNIHFRNPFLTYTCVLIQ
jgi:hypothetical protein